MDNIIQEDNQREVNIATPPEVTGNILFFGQNTKSAFSKKKDNVLVILYTIITVIALIIAFRYNVKHGFKLLDILFALFFSPIYIIYRTFN